MKPTNPLVVVLVIFGAGFYFPNAAADDGDSHVGEPLLHYGCCDASAGVGVSSNLFIVANDEDNLLRVYRRDRSGAPVQAFQVGPFLGVDLRKPESDLEAAVRVGNRIYWLTSHGRNRKGVDRESRHRFFATTFKVSDKGVKLKTVGRPYSHLLDDFIWEPKLARFRLGIASLHAPKETNALNIEGLCAGTNGELLIGFRNPIPEGRALIVPLQNPDGLLHGKRARFGDPILLDLGGRGVRDMAFADGRYLIIAGPFDARGHSHLYAWKGGTNAPTKLSDVHFKGSNPEALVLYPGAPSNEFQVLSDDGTRKIDGADCKTIKDPAHKWFRSYRIRL